MNNKNVTIRIVYRFICIKKYIFFLFLSYVKYNSVLYYLYICCRLHSIYYYILPFSCLQIIHTHTYTNKQLNSIETRNYTKKTKKFS